MSSPFKRAIDTIIEFADSLGLQIKLVDEFRERKVGNSWIDDFTAFTQNQWRDFSFKLSDGECLKEVQERNVTVLLELIKQYKGKNIVIGGHGTTLYNYQLFRLFFRYEDFENIKPKCSGL